VFGLIVSKETNIVIPLLLTRHASHNVNRAAFPLHFQGYLFLAIFVLLFFLRQLCLQFLITGGRGGTEGREGRGKVRKSEKSERGKLRDHGKFPRNIMKYKKKMRQGLQLNTQEPFLGKFFEDLVLYRANVL
jgi:hypothetical protein